MSSCFVPRGIGQMSYRSCSGHQLPSYHGNNYILINTVDLRLFTILSKKNKTAIKLLDMNSLENDSCIVNMARSTSMTQLSTDQCYR